MVRNLGLNQWLRSLHYSHGQVKSFNLTIRYQTVNDCQ